MSEVLEEIEPNLREAGVELVTQLDSAARIHADPASVRSVVRNLLDNALKAVAGNTERKRIEVRVVCGEGKAALRVEDNGCGFESDEAQRLFEKFYRQGDEMRRTSPGVGLGLYLVRRWAELDGGQARARSAGPGHGARFEVRWPAVNP